MPRKPFTVVLLLSLALAVPSLAAEEIKIEVLYPLTGGAAAEGRELRDGAELAVEIANNVKADLDMAMAKNGGVPVVEGISLDVFPQGQFLSWGQMERESLRS